MVSADTIPSKVAALAASQRLGNLLAARGGTSRRSSAIGFVVAGLGALALGALVGWAATAADSRQLGFGALTLVCALFPVLVLWGIRLFVRGTHGYYLYEGGLVHEKNGKPRLVRWPEVAELRTRRLGQKAAEFARTTPGLEMVTADTVAGYDVVPTGGGKLTIQVGGVRDPGYARFCAAIERLAAQGGARLTG